jgi:superfamily I DNA and/or RNA helicase
MKLDLILLTLVRDRQTPFMRSLNRMNVAFTRAKSRMVILGDLPEKTEEAQNTGKDCTMLDALNDYHVTRTETKHLKEAQSIVNKALKNLN